MWTRFQRKDCDDPAWRFDGSEDNVRQAMHWFRSAGIITLIDEDNRLRITHKGKTVVVNIGDYLVMTWSGEFDVIPANVFELNWITTGLL